MFRIIFVASKEVGLAKAFHVKKRIRAVFNVIKLCNNHEHHGMMTVGKKRWWVNNMKHVALKMFDVDGNVVLLCNHGRSRSPMYLVAYLVIIYGMEPSNALAMVSKILFESRRELLDRHECLVPIIHFISNDKYDLFKC